MGIFGSRSLTDARVKIMILDEIQKLQPICISTAQEPAGVCEMAQIVAKEMAIPLMLYFLNFKYLAGAFEHRSQDIIKFSTHFLLIHDGESKGTHNELELVKKSGKPFRYEVLEKTVYKEFTGLKNDNQRNINPKYKHYKYVDLQNKGKVQP